MLDSTLLRKRFYKKLNIPGMDGSKNSRRSPADSGFSADSLPSPVSECAELTEMTMTRSGSADSVFEKPGKSCSESAASTNNNHAVVGPPTSPSAAKACAVPLPRNYRVKYLGNITLDRRYTQPMLPWIVADLRREGLKSPVDVLLEVRDSSLRGVSYLDNRPLFEHQLNTISKFAQTSSDQSCFTYLQRDAPDTMPKCHVFQASDKDTVSIYFGEFLGSFLGLFLPVQNGPWNFC